MNSIGTQPPKGIPRILVGIWKSRMEGWATQTRTTKKTDFSSSVSADISFQHVHLPCSVLVLSLFLFRSVSYLYFLLFHISLIGGHRTALLMSSLYPSLLEAVLHHSVLFICVFLFILHSGKNSSSMSLLVLPFTFLLPLRQLFWLNSNR